LLRQETFIVRVYGSEGGRKGSRRSGSIAGVVEVVRQRAFVPFDSFDALKTILVEHSPPKSNSRRKPLGS